MISFIIVNYKSEKELNRCLIDLSKISGSKDFEVIVVNNDEKKLSLPILPFQSQMCIEVNQNIGYAAANNRGFSHASEDYVCFLNPDTYAFSDDLTRILDHVDDRTVASPCILSDDDSVQEWSVGNTVSLKETLRNNLLPHTKPWLATKTTPVGWASGAALFMKKVTFEKVGKFDEDYFLYFEDVDLCYRAQKIGIKTILVPHVSIHHSCGKSSKKNPQKKKRWYYRSQDLYFKKHFGNLQLFLLRLFRLFHK